MPVVICGSVAYDTIMVFHDRFTNHILPDQLHVLNVSFQVPQLRREFGGCAGNIAYSLELLGGDPLPMATVGRDFDPYARWMDECAIDRRFVTRIDTEYTAQAFITTDLDDNQITAFHPGAMNSAHLNDVRDAPRSAMGMVSPDGREAMIEHAAQLAECGTPFIFDPGQGLPLFDGDDLRRFIDLATWITVNDYEWEVVRERTGYDVAAAVARVDALIVTRGAHGSVVHTHDASIEGPAGEGGRDGGPDRLRRRLSGRPDPRPRQRPGLADHRPAGVADGGDQGSSTPVPRTTAAPARRSRAASASRSDGTCSAAPRPGGLRPIRAGCVRASPSLVGRRAAATPLPGAGRRVRRSPSVVGWRDRGYPCGAISVAASRAWNASKPVIGASQTCPSQTYATGVSRGARSASRAGRPMASSGMASTTRRGA